MSRQNAVQNQKEINTVSGKRPTAGRLRGIPMAVLLLISVVLMFVIIRYYYVELDDQLFAERSTHLVEITEKVADIFDITIARSWDSVNTMEQFLSVEWTRAQTEDELMQYLKDMSRFRTDQGSIFLLLDDDFRYYSSDGNKGYWRELPMIIKSSCPKSPDLRQPANPSHMLCWLWISNRSTMDFRSTPSEAEAIHIS